MARIGDTIRPELMAYNYLPGALAIADMQRGTGANIAKAIEGIGDTYAKVKGTENEIKASSELISAAMELYGDRGGYLGETLATLNDSSKSPAERARLARDAGPLIQLGISKFETEADQKFRNDSLALDRDRFAWDKGAEGRRIAGTTAQAEAENRRWLADAVAKYLPVKELEEQAGVKLPDMKASSKLIEQYIQEGNGYAANAAAEAYATIRTGQLGKLGVMPTLKPHKIGGEKDGKPYEMDVLIDPQGNLYDLNRQPLNGGQGGGAFTAPTTHYSTGAAVGGPDEMQDKWTNQGYSATGKNLAPGMVAVNPKAHPMGTVFEDADTGEVFIAGDKHGNSDPNVIDIYQPPDAYTGGKGQRNLRVIGREQQVGKSPEEVAAQVARWKTQAAAVRMAQQQAPAQPPGSIVSQYIPERGAWGDGSGGQNVGPAMSPEVARSIQQAIPQGPRSVFDPSAFGPGATSPGYSNAGVLPPMPIEQRPQQPYSGPNQAPRITLGQRPLVSPTNTPDQVQQMRRAESGDKRLETTLAEAQTLAASVPALKQTAALLDQVKTGFGAEAMTTAKRILGADVSSAEQLQTLLGDQVMARVAQTKGAVSEKEMQLFQDYSANFAKTPDGNRKIVAWQLAAADRAQKIARTIQAGFQAGKDPYTIEAEVSALRDAESLNSILTPPPPAPKGIPVEEDAENAWLRGKPTNAR